MVPIRNGALEAVRWEYVVFSPMIKNTCPNTGTPSPGRPAERARPDAGLAGAVMAAITPAASASTSTNSTPNLGRIRHPAFSASRARQCGPRTTDTGSISHGVGHRWRDYSAREAEGLLAPRG